MALNDHDYAIDLRDVTKVYRGRVHALRGVTMQVRRGEVFGLLGPNGAGKSTLVKIMMTIIKPTRVAGTLLGARVGHKGTLRRVGYLPENHRFPKYLTGRQTLHFFSALSGVDRKTRKVRCGELLEAVGMQAWADSKISQYSKGMMQRIGLAHSLAADPDLILLDEPTDGVDPSGRKDIRDVLLALRQQGKTIFINSHLLSELETVSDRVAILVQGLVARQGTLDELTLGRQCYMIEVASESNPWDLMSEALPGAFGAVELAERGGKWKPAAAPPPLTPQLSEMAFKPTSPLALRPAAPLGGPLRGQISKGPWCEFDGTTLRIGTVDVRDIQAIIDAVRSSGLMIRRVNLFRPSLEELFFEAVTNEATGQRYAPGAARKRGCAMTQTWALLVDAYRDLNSRKMFWIVLIISTLFAAGFASVNVTPAGLMLFGWRTPVDINSDFISNAQLQKMFFFNFGVQWWLTWVASILAIISTAEIFPSLITSGTVDLYLSKPISRFRLFLTKYIFGLLFVAMQMTCYCVASFLVIGLRGHEWEPGIFLAIPLVVLFFSYLYSICVLVGVTTRSTVAAILLTLLLWVVFWAVGYTEKNILIFKIAAANQVTRLDHEVSSLQSQIATREHAAATPTTRQSSEIDEMKMQIQIKQVEKSNLEGTGERAHFWAMKVENFVPKTAATIALLQRELIEHAKLLPPEAGAESNTQFSGGSLDLRRAVVQADAQIRNRSLPWILGTSVAFEVVMFLLAAWIFCRRDY